MRCAHSSREGGRTHLRARPEAAAPPAVTSASGYTERHGKRAGQVNGRKTVWRSEDRQDAAKHFSPVPQRWAILPARFHESTPQTARVGTLRDVEAATDIGIRPIVRLGRQLSRIGGTQLSPRRRLVASKGTYPCRYS